MDPIMITQCNDWLFSGRNALWIHLFSCFSTPFVHMQKSAGTWSHDTQRWAMQTREVGQRERLFWATVAFQFRSSSVGNVKSVRGKNANILTFLLKENCRTCHVIGADKPESFLFGGVNHQWEVHSSVGLMAKLETAGFSGIQTSSETFLHSTLQINATDNYLHYQLFTCSLDQWKKNIRSHESA